MNKKLIKSYLRYPFERNCVNYFKDECYKKEKGFRYIIFAICSVIEFKLR